MGKRRRGWKLKKKKKYIPTKELPEEYADITRFVCRFCWENKQASIINTGPFTADFFRGQYLYLCPNCHICRSCHYEDEYTGDTEIAWLPLSKGREENIRKGLIKIVRMAEDWDAEGLKRGVAFYV